MDKRIIIAMLVAAIIVSTALVLASCSAGRYRVNCTEHAFNNVKRSYAEGAEVKIYFPYVATDTDYRFYIDGEPIRHEYSDEKGFIISFTMPAHDVELTYTSSNSMTMQFHSDGIEPDTVLFSYCEKVFSADGTSIYEVVVKTTDTPGEHLMTVYDTDGTTREYAIPCFPYESVYSYVSENDIAGWNDLAEYESLDGKLVSVTVFMDGEYVMASTDRMPESGELVLSYIYSTFGDYMTDEYKCG